MVSLLRRAELFAAAVVTCGVFAPGVSLAQRQPASPPPNLIVFITVDQMRADYWIALLPSSPADSHACTAGVRSSRTHFKITQLPRRPRVIP